MNDDVLVPLFAITLPLLIVCTVMGFRLGASRREMTHRERMRAMELGLPVATSPPGAAFLCAAIGAGVPIAAFLFSMIVSMETRDQEVALIIWFIAMVVSLAALFAAYRLANRLFFGNASRNPHSLADPGVYNKNLSDPDLYDVVSRRG